MKRKDDDVSLRKRDDWDEALEEARNNAIARGEIAPVAPFAPGPDYDYATTFVVRLRDLLDDDSKPPNVLVTGARA